jgi:muramoyltetrapeptide carboxypeptidase LdcA involved in peptidoglycan recycling
MVESVRKTLFCADPIGTISPNTTGWTVEELDWRNPENQLRRRQLNPSPGSSFLQGKGIVEGKLIGGCVEVLDWLRGTEFWPGLPEWENAILFLETSEEGPPAAYVGRFIRVLAAMGCRESCSAGRAASFRPRSLPSTMRFSPMPLARRPA